MLFLPKQTSIERHIKKRHKPYVFADELLNKVQRVRGCLLTNTNILPLPTVEVAAAWAALPNVIVNDSVLLIKAEMVSLRAPPHSPTTPAFDPDAPTFSDLSSDGSPPADDWVLVDDTPSTSPDAEAPHTLEGSVASEDDVMSRPSYPDHPLEQYIHEESEENPPSSTENSSLSSDQDSLSSCGCTSPKPEGFHNMVHKWLEEYHDGGADACADSLIAFAVNSAGTTLLAARVGRAVVREVEKTSYTKGQILHDAIRFSALAAFKKCWGLLDGEWRDAPSALSNTALPTPHGISIASAIGSFFSEKMTTTKDIHLCLSVLFQGEKRYDRLCAMHALLVHANDKLCKNRNLPPLMQFRDDITAVNKKTGEYLWAISAHSRMIITDILATIERWFVTQAIRRERCRMNAWTGRRSIRSRAVGPRGWVNCDSLEPIGH